MNGIPPELIIVLIFVAFSVLEGMGRKKKADREGGAGEAPAPPRRPARNREGVAEAGKVARADSSGGAPSPGPAGSEGLIPEDVWAEILGLARGTTPKPDPQPVREPVREPVEESSWDRGRREDETLELLPEFEARSLEPLEARPDVVRADWNRVTVPSGKAKRKASAPAVVTSRPKGGGRPRRAIFGGGSTKELQKAIILQEVLGPPVGMKEQNPPSGFTGSGSLRRR